MSVSVCMAVYNGERFIKAQCESILKQLAANDELIVSDDHSTDNTIAIVESLNDKRVKIVQNTLGKGAIKNFQHAIIQATGELIFLSDQDDVWMDDKVERTLPLFEQYDVVVSDATIVDENLSEIAPSLLAFINGGKGIIKNMLKSTYYGSCMAFKRSLLPHILPFPDTIEIGHDLWIGLVGEMLNAKVFFYQQPLIMYRRHSAAFTNTGQGKSKRSLNAKLRGRVIMIREVIRFYLKHRLCKKA
ncbi:glycosyltransferase family 2 protein [Chitinophaga silvisoli]|uniref:Glycosyltransferase family 2 protein n=1 Tax=Chitinophaga silvisoli TaxID=2291814 RepID=A0A3E1P6X5_9BACT|nr:glycosyltransferase family 2 protein [Chitinophaga silvisoli]RFM35850.1 glycosyltransferase family 2 protein [Chitinophaga silvisoli]